jgi:DMSO/TMAO reductase YedYZ molybdopterin-dependent catalytic subunit
MERVLDPKNEVMLCYGANGVDLPEDHGHPVRLLCPGFVGIRSCKWLNKITISDKESQSKYQQNAYKPFREKEWKDVDPSKYPAPLGHCINSVISQPLMGQDIIVYKAKPRVVFKGVAVGDGWTGGRIVKV